MESATLGVVADTHVPDRARQLNPILTSTFRAAGVKAILHCGDVCTPEVLETLGKIAPVYAVRGNRDVYRLSNLPRRLTLEFVGVKIGLMHGHGRWYNYLYERVEYIFAGIRPGRYRRRALKTFDEQVKVVVFGHIHKPIQEWIEGRLIFNPGSACCTDNTDLPPSAGLLHLDSEGKIEAEHFFLA